MNAKATSPTRITALAVRARKGSVPLVMITAYDAPGARIAHRAGADMILVGDSLAMVVLGYDDTLQVTIDDMAHHTAAVHRGLQASVATPPPLCAQRRLRSGVLPARRVGPGPAKPGLLP